MAYAGVASLMRTIESLLISNSPMQSQFRDHREELLALREKVSSLEEFLRNFEKSNVAGEMTDLEVNIKEVANVVEYTIQVRLTKTVTAKNKIQRKWARRRFRQSLQRIAGDVDCVLKESTKIQDKGKNASKESLVQDFSSSPKDILNVKSDIVGRNDQKKELLEKLIQHSGSYHELKIIPIIGMGGIGKTTLAKEVYNNECIRSHFDIRAWATISQQHNVKEILLSLLGSTKGDSFYKDDAAELADMLQKSLKGRRYLIVLDDTWSDKAWDDVRQCFPSENKGSRILLTTRDNKVARFVGTKNLSLEMGFMNQNESWNLFKSVAFVNEALLSDEFETTGKQIVDQCQGLPLTIVVVAGLLSKSERTIECWKTVAKDVMSLVTNDPDNQCSHVLKWSYNHLPNHVKACLLYFGTFPEDSEIRAKELVSLWIAEGFLKLEKESEGEAKKCLKDLVDRCLVLVNKRSYDKSKIKSYKVHDLIYELCLKEARSQNIFVMEDSGSYRALLTPGHHHLIRRQPYDEGNNLLKQTRSVFVHSKLFLNQRFNRFSLVRIMDLSRIKLEKFPPEILCLIWLTYLEMYGGFYIPSEICRLWNLQTFIVLSYEWSSLKELPETIWELTQLRHLELDRFYLPNPPSVSVGEERRISFSNIQTICGLSPCSFTKEVISGIQNAKRLKIDEDPFKSFCEPGLFENLVHLRQLEKLHFFSCPLRTIPGAKAFPSTLKKLRLYRTKLKWKELNIIGELPNLEVLKLDYYACVGREWHCETPFTQLKCLKLGSCGLKYWKATDEHFPVLERLVIECCYDLEEIPIEFADIYSLQLIELYYCKPVLSDSALRIKQDKEDLGNEADLDVRIIRTIPAFPATLKKFRLYRTELKWEELNIIGQLPNLEVLQLRMDACVGIKWHCQTRFTQLKHLQIDNCGLMYWKATDEHFPVLERLAIRSCHYLKEIPIEFAHIYSLQLILLEDCKP